MKIRTAAMLLTVGILFTGCGTQRIIVEHVYPSSNTSPSSEPVSSNVESSEPVPSAASSEAASQPEASSAASSEAASQPEASSAVPALSDPSSVPAGSRETAPWVPPVSGDITAQYYALLAQEELLDEKIELLEMSYRRGEITRQEMVSQKQDMEREKDALDNQADLLEHQVPRAEPEAEWKGKVGDLQALLGYLREAEQKEFTAEQALDNLERDFRSGAVSETDFLAQYPALKQTEDRLDDQIDWLEDQLEFLGWDD